MNWFDIFYIILFLFWMVVMQRQSLDIDTFRTGTALTFRVYGLSVLVFLKGIIVRFAVFVGGVVYTVQHLAAFSLALLTQFFGGLQIPIIHIQVDVIQATCQFTP